MRRGTLFVVLSFLLLLALVSVAAAEPPPAQPDSSYNLLTNPGLEQYKAPYGKWHGVNVQVPTGWQRFWYGDPEPAWMDGRVYDKSPWGCNCWVERMEGETALFLVSNDPYNAGILQQVTGLTPGVGYGFHGVLLTIHEAAGAPMAPDRMFKLIGVDPTGGTDPLAPTVRWTTPNGKDKAWDLQQRTSFFAQGSTATVFMQIKSLDPADPRQLGILDSTLLAQTPTVSATSPETSTQSVFTVNWDNVQLAPGAKSFQGCDVQWMDEADGVWYDWFSQTFETQADFTGQWGHTYVFRARAWQKYQNNAWLYGEYRDGGDSRTRVFAGTITGQVVGPQGWPAPGAMVAVSGTPYRSTAGANGRYTLLVDEPLSDGQSVAVSHPYWASPSPVFGVKVDPGSTQTINWALRPQTDAMANGEFEDGFEAWTVLSQAGVTPQIVSDPVHSGHLAAALGGAANVAHTTGVSQTLDLVDAWQPGVAFWYRPAKGDSGDHFNLVLTVVSGAGEPVTTTQVITPSLDLAGWQHAWYPLTADGRRSRTEPNGYVTGSVTVEFLVRDSGGPATLVYLDEASLGGRPGGQRRLCFPLILR